MGLKMSLALLKRIFSICFVVSMLMANVYLVTFDSVSKFLKGGIMIEISSLSSDGLDAPAVTFCPIGPDGKTYFTNGFDSFKSCTDNSTNENGI